jgi:glycosyltransferase involved in cell wall biosynthesis
MRDWSVTVIVPAYKHEKFILDALAGAVSQDIFDSTKVLVGDDCSSDETFEKASEFAEQYPNISVFRNHTNLGWTGNYSALLDRCDTEFMAVLEADDFWVAPDKLRRQVEFLRDNQRVNGCFSELHSFETGKGIFHRVSRSNNQRYALVHLLDILDTNPPMTFSNCCYRTDSFRQVFSQLKDKFFCDWITNMVISEPAGLGFVPGSSMVYRIHRGGSWSGASPHVRQKMLENVLKTIMTVIPGRYSSFFQEKLNRLVGE